MIKIILPLGIVVWQIQLGDSWDDPQVTYTFKFVDPPRGRSMDAMYRIFARKGALKRRQKRARQNPPRPSHVLGEYFPELLEQSPTPGNAAPAAKGDIAAPEPATPASQAHCKQDTLPDCAFRKMSLLKDARDKFIDRVPPVPSTRCEDFCTPAGLEEEWKYYQEVPEYRGLFQHLLLLNSFSYWDEVEATLRQEGFSPKGFSVKEFVKWDLLRHSTGALFTTQFQDIAGPWDKSVLAGAFDNPERVPAPHHFSYYYGFLTPQHYMAFFLQLVRECIKHQVIVPRFVAADGVFLRSWAGNFTKDKAGNPTDPEASITVHGQKYYGKGFTTIAFFAWCGKRWLPVYCKTYTGSVSENAVYQDAVAEFLAALPYDWKAMAYDLGAGSADNRRFTRGKGMICVMPANLSASYDTVVEIGTERYFFDGDIPYGMSTGKFGRLYDHRAQVEAGLSPLDLAYNMKEMSRMGLVAAAIHMLKYFSLLLLHALTAYKVNREKLIMSAKAFTAIKL